MIVQYTLSRDCNFYSNLKCSFCVFNIIFKGRLKVKKNIPLAADIRFLHTLKFLLVDKFTK